MAVTAPDTLTSIGFRVVPFLGCHLDLGTPQTLDELVQVLEQTPPPNCFTRWGRGRDALQPEAVVAEFVVRYEPSELWLRLVDGESRRVTIDVSADPYPGQKCRRAALTIAWHLNRAFPTSIWMDHRRADLSRNQFKRHLRLITELFMSVEKLELLFFAGQSGNGESKWLVRRLRERVGARRAALGRDGLPPEPPDPEPEDR